MIDRLLDEGYPSTDICSALIHLLQAGESSAPASAPVAPSAPQWVKAKARPVDRPPEAEQSEASDEPDGEPNSPSSKKQKYERPARTGREAGMATLFLNIGRKQLITPADVVGKIAGVTRLPAEVVGAIDIHQRHTLVDVAEDKAELVMAKLKGIKMKGVALEPAKAGDVQE
jgi:ATP-dependent RNA helicase DeaD